MASTIKEKGSLLVHYNFWWSSIWIFKQTTVYYHFKKNNGSLGQGLNKSELLLHKETQSNDQEQLANTIVKHASRSSFTTKITHMEGDKIFGFCKWKSNLFQKLQGIHIGRIVSNFLAHMSTPKHEDCMWKLNTLLLALISMRLWISSMEVVRSWKFRVEMECGI